MKKCILAALCVCAMLSGGYTQAEEAYPSRPITLIVPSSPGGGADFLARFISPELARLLGKPIVIENKPGASGTIAGSMVSKTKPDGYTLIMAQAASIVAAPYIYKHLTYKPLKDLVPVALVAKLPNILAVNAKSDIKSLAELIAMAKAKPGTVTFGSSGFGTPSHLAGEMLQEVAGIKMIHVPYKGAGPAANALLANQINAMFVLSSTALPMLSSKEIRALAVSSAERSPTVPDIPTVAELGFPGFEVNSWFGVFAPAGTPHSVIEKLNTGIARVLKEPKTEKAFKNLSMDAGGGSPAQFQKFIDSESQVAERLINRSGAVAK
ncbi:Bug family tripartite tricarboxylate transporter substrate binding protein [Candidimonas nitroreducens]|uniref:LacI family transcriptional regulator n=1 Tax=Candidimonas nitroreducens TaxID=683354 RepID=A0A225LW54_9BURK|nr:tripartite tricarboxylate transporter substrate binding protein [Candidimonas nitroreducens]OWT53567.1 hypothetical protein CEY11_24200 [Candidimonas nitroreducens]